MLSAEMVSPHPRSPPSDNQWVQNLQIGAYPRLVFTNDEAQHPFEREHRMFTWLTDLTPFAPGRIEIDSARSVQIFQLQVSPCRVNKNDVPPHSQKSFIDVCDVHLIMEKDDTYGISNSLNLMFNLFY